MLESALAVWAEVEPILAGTGFHLSLAGPTSCGRTPEVQHSLFEQGRHQDERGKWVPNDPVHRTGIVTNADGYSRKSNHQPGRAIDAGLRSVDPVPGMGKFWWDNEACPSQIRALMCQVVGVFMKHGWKWGGDFKSLSGDRHHFEKPVPKGATA